jgi:hypothetical protein
VPILIFWCIYFSDGYFDVTGDGKLIVQKPLPRDDLIYNVGKADIQVQVSDTGTPPLSTSITATVDVLSEFYYIFWRTSIPVIQYMISWFLFLFKTSRFRGIKGFFISQFAFSINICFIVYVLLDFYDYSFIVF